jgi:ABC-type amino acid transport substrate-binding protein
MNKTNRTLLLAISTATALCVAALTATAQESKRSDQPKQPAAQARTGTHLSECTAYLKPDYAESIKPAAFLEGNKLVGSFRGFDADFAKFTGKDSKELIFIPRSAILYMTGKQKFFTLE